MSTFRIAWKDLTVVFRDRTALILMIAAPLILTFGLALISGRLTGSSGGSFRHIPIVAVNQDAGELGADLVNVLTSSEMNDLLSVTAVDTPSAAKALVEANTAAAAILIPDGFTDAVTGREAAKKDLSIEVYANPESEISAGIVTAVVESFAQQVQVGQVSGQVAVEQMLAAGLLSPAQAAEAGMRFAKQAVQQQESGAFLRLGSTQREAAPQNTFDAMSYFAPSMAILFLMFTVSWGARSLLMEKENGTLGRLASAPIHRTSILGGKMFGIYLTALAQMIILLAANAMLFGVKFGDPVALTVLVTALVAAASGWGMLIAAVARSAGQVNTLGSALMLTFGILGGGFLPVSNMPDWFQWISKITPNAWGIEGFLALGLGDGLPQIAGRVAVLAGMALVLFAVSVWLLGRRRLMES